VGQTRQSALVAVLLVSAACGGLLALANSDDGERAGGVADSNIVNASASSAAATGPAATAAVVGGVTPDTAAADGLQDLDGSDLTVADGCLLSAQSIRFGATGESVSCLQQALVSGGFYTGAATGQFDQATDTAVRQMQEDRNLFVDGVVGRESAISLGIWPDEESLVIRTAPRPAGSVDLMGYPLSSVAVSGPDAPPLPPSSGDGKRVVYERAGQRVWAVNSDNVVVRSYLVAGSKYSNEEPGTHKVYSKSEMSTAWNGKAYLPLMIRYLKTDIGAIGFHGIPRHVEDNSPYMIEAELGQRLSGGCQRQAIPDARFLWDFAQVGTTVVVI